MRSIIIVIAMLASWAQPVWATISCLETTGEGKVRRLQTFFEEGEVIAKRGFDKNGTVILYENEIPDGIVQSFYPDGQCASKGSYLQGKKEGVFEYYYPNGKLKNIITYVQGNRHGEALYYSQTGALIEKRNYIQGVCESKETSPVDQTLSMREMHQDLSESRHVQSVKPFNYFQKNVEPSNMQGTVMFSGNWVYAAYAMNNVNEIIDLWSDYLDYYGRGTVDKLSDGTSMGLEVAWWATDQIIVGIGVEGMGKKTEGGDDTLGVIFDLNAIEFEGTLKWSQKLGDHILSVGAGLCYLELVNSTEYNYLSDTGYLDGYRTFTGSTVGYKVMLSYDVKWSEFFGLGLTTGYRVAEIKSVRYTAAGYINEQFETLDGANGTIDFSGFFFKGGIRIYL